MLRASTHDGPIWDYVTYTGANAKPLGTSILPLIAIPTTAGTRSEVSQGSVLDNPVLEMKAALLSPRMYSRAALVDPELTYTMPPRTTAHDWLPFGGKVTTMVKRIFPILAAIPGWVSAAQSKELQKVDVKFMTRGCCYAGSRADKEGPGGFGKSDNNPKELTDTKIGKDGELALVALPQDETPLGKKYRGMRLLLVNRTKAEAAFRACDSRLSIVQEALDSEGRWKPIEYLPSSWCGNSYHRVFLPAGHYWAFVVPTYTGTMKTKLRFVLQGPQPLCSNEFEGGINPEQFARKQGHTPDNLMDPYNE